MKHYMTGISVGACVHEIALGKMNIEKVRRIIGSCSFRDINRLIEAYVEEQWGYCAEKAKKVARRLWAEGRILQPALTERRIPDRSESKTNWVRSEKQIQWRKLPVRDDLR